MMLFLSPPAAVLGLVATALLPSTSAKPYPVHIEELRELHNASQVEKRQCAGTLCGYYNQLCCTNGQQCVTDSNNQAQCAGDGANLQGGGWVYSTFIYTETDLVTRTSIYSTFLGVTPQATATCDPCGSACCEGGYYCHNPDTGTCRQIGGGSSPGVIATGSPTATVPFETPIVTGVNGTLVESNQGGGGLSGGAIAGIVIGVLAGIILLILICFYCCAKAAFDSILAIFGMGKRRRHTHEETTYIEGHHSSGGGGRRWYGQPARPSRPHKKDGGLGFLGLAGILGTLAVALGLKRRHDRRHEDDKTTTVTDSSYYSYSDYTSSSSASSSDRRTRHTRHSSRR